MDRADNPKLQIVSQIATQDRHFDVTRRGAIAERTEVLRQCLQPTSQIAVDGIVRKTAERAIGRIKDPLAMGKAIYDWVIGNTEFDSAGKGLGNANVANLLENGKLVGRSADIAQLLSRCAVPCGYTGAPSFRVAHGHLAPVR